jgi:hypothetical protein
MMSAIVETRAAHVLEARQINATKDQPVTISYPTAISVRVSFTQVSNIPGVIVPVRRPRKNAPSLSPNDGIELQAELDAWDEASDEALRKYDAPQE